MAAKKIKCTPGCPNKFDETCCRSRGESPDYIPVPEPVKIMTKAQQGLAIMDYGLNGDVPNKFASLVPTSGILTITDKDIAKDIVEKGRNVDVSVGYLVLDEVNTDAMSDMEASVFDLHKALVATETRQCSRQGCRKPAVRAEGHTRWSKLCKDHNRNRSSAIEASHLKPRCGCGNIAPKGKEICSRCTHIEREGRIASRGEGWEVDELMRDVDELFRAIFAQTLSYLPAMRDLKQITARIDSFRANIPQSAKTHKAVLRLRELAMKHEDPELESIADELEVVKIEDGPEQDL